ncbi:histidine phosphatase family protein [Pseudovibrio sp. Tun.PSC04-5.I4]|uniref:histidine phosphatase family protein n=1 Tax=Pseudovibrio sp. Tun.PSC04-5.I4 TaxID=1798213 RepID=UPI000884BBAA|nr:histidine phosphatase family protein [Pseudovibrio sp. Tun.PSC04-5.I4]SDQ81884.1 probable phosphoglycerate mutase [Pseudovibrio sp. Tun.PSC04-5.I4]
MTVPTMPLAKITPTPLLYVRHGQTDWNLEGRMQGGQDIPLNDTGRNQARRNGMVMKDFLPDLSMSSDDFVFVCSPMIRARETMELLRTEMGLDPQDYKIDKRLREITFGEVEGMTVPEMKIKRPEVIQNRRQDKWGYVHPGGESYKMVSERIYEWMSEQQDPMIVVAHGVVMRVLRGLLCGYAPAEIPDLDTPQDQFLLWRDGSEAWI